ncbi:rhodanese-like domain-containing protein [Kordia jejudonensis]|uniref:rhodanese-like domain-containing protein n=1 Tax=Kordia jejudonensis TaxID=1348245 RepID=UPI0015695FBE|nr:rhodanese-like domain-containing protein [Kordia jejudonensis]
MSFINSLLGTKTKSSDTIEILNAATFKDAISKEKVQLVDVRTTLEYRSGHIENAVNIDFFDRANFNENFAGFNREKPLYLYCRSGNRSQRAAKKLVEIGFKKIYDLKGGFKAWK